MPSMCENHPRRTPVDQAKRRFETERGALERLAEIIANPQTPVIPTRAYSCPFCNGWHLAGRSMEQRKASIETSRRSR